MVGALRSHMPFVVVQSLNHVWPFAISWTAAHQVLWPYDSPSLSPGICSSSCTLSQWCHPTISPSVVPFSCPQSFIASGSFPMSHLFPSCGQSTGASTSVSVFPVNIQGWFPLGLTGLISLLSKELSRVFCSTTVWKHQFFTLCLLYGLILTSIQDYWENITLTRQTVFSKVMSLLFKMLSRFAIAFLPRSKCLLISWLHSPSTYHESKSESCLVVSDSLRSINYKVHGILQTEILEWVAIPFSRGSSQHRDWIQISHIAGGFFTSWATREPQEYWSG